MADEPSIDEILASLDRLLREGEGRNDDPEAVSPTVGEPESPPRHDAPTPHFFEVLDNEVEAGHAHVGADEAGADGAADAAEPAQERQVDEPPGDEPGAQASRLFVLTDAMMVDDQPSLPLAMGGEAGGDAMDETGEAEQAMRQAMEMPESGEPESAAMPEPGPAYEAQPGMDMEPEIVPVLAPHEAPEDTVAEAPEPAWDEADVQALVDQVTDDVCSAMAEQLPEMIRMALAIRLGAFIDARTNNQDTGSQK